MFRSRLCTLLFLSAFVTTTGSGIHVFGDEPKKPNFIIVFCDNLGYGDIEPFGSKLHRTPHLNRMAREGRKFTHFCVTAGVCTPSRSSLMTGCYAQRVGMHHNDRDGLVLRPVSPYGLHPDEVTIAEVLKSEGYATAIVGKWHLGDQPEFLPTRQGFDWFYGVPYSDDMTERIWAKDNSSWPPLPLMENETVIEAPCDRNGLTKRYTEKAMQWIDEKKDKPFFLYFPQAMPGSTRTPFSSEAFKGKSGNGPWGDSIEELDWSIGMMLDQLVELGIAENTIVIWTSDNGAPINRDRTDLSRGSNLPLHGRGYTTSEGAFRVPTIAWQPGKIPGGTVCDELATTMDLLPTFAKLSGASVPDGRKIDGHDIAPLLFGKEGATTPYEALYYYNQRQLQAIRSGRWKLFLPVAAASHPHFSKALPPQDLLFDVVNDISCKHNVADAHPDVVSRLKQIAENARRDLGDSGRVGAGQRDRGAIPKGTSPKPQTMTTSALDVIEGVRGGRHWVDEKTAPPKTPQQTLDSFRIEPGYQVELFASEPLVMDPVAITFDAHGRMYVVEYGDYPIGPPEGEPPLSRIVMLEDSDGDGKADRRHLFADNLDFAHSLMAYRGGLLVGAKTKILYLRDEDGDHRADVNETLFDGFTPAHPQMQIGNPRWGIDNWIYFNYGPGKVVSKSDPDNPITLPRKDVRLHPKSMRIEPDSGLGQFGNTVDRWGNRFYCTNRNPIMATFLSPQVLARNPFHVVAKAHYDVGKAGGETTVFPLVDMKSNYLSHAGTHTSACGTTAYTGDLVAGDLLDSVFVCEPIGHLVTRSIIERDGTRLRTRRAEEKADFLASSDTWFRPSSLATGPDGALYLADMYRLWVEHPKFLPPEIAARLDWRAGDDLGRIYRIVPSGANPKPYSPPESVDDMVKLIADANGWRQFLGQRLLVEGEHQDAATKIRPLLKDRRNPTTRLHAMWTLHGLSRLTDDDLITVLDDDHAVIRADAVRIATDRIKKPQVFERVAALVTDNDASVRLEVGLAMSATDAQRGTSILLELAKRDGDDAWFTDALLTSAKNRSGDLLAGLTSDQTFSGQGNAARIALVRKLGAITGARGDVSELGPVLRLIGDKSRSGQWWRAALVGGLGQGLPRHRGDLGRISFAKLLSGPPPSLAKEVSVVREWFGQVASTSTDPKRGATERAAATEVLAFQPIDEVAETLENLITHDQPAEVQVAAMNALARNGSTVAAKIVLRRWSELGPATRGLALAFLLRRTDSTRLTLEAMADGKMKSSVLGIDQRVRLLKHADKSIQKSAIDLFGGAVSSNRQAVAKKYESSLAMTPSASEGRKAFQRICANCHRIDGIGHEAGPDLSDVRNRSKPALLYDILDPNAKVEPRFTAYSILTLDGIVYNGLIESETDEAVVLKMAEGKRETIGRAQIDRIKVSDVSLMPEGIEKELTPQQMADLLEYLKNRS